MKYVILNADSSIASRTNLVVNSHCEVDKLLTSKAENGDVIIESVRYFSGGTQREARALREVILCAGSFGSSAILERSGMGDRSILTKLGIPVVIELPGVGSNLADHPNIASTYEISKGLVSADNYMTSSKFADEQLKLYNTRRQGMLTHSISLVDFEPLNVILTKEEIEEGLKYLESETSHLPKLVLESVTEQLLKGTPIEFALLDKRTVSQLPCGNLLPL